MQITLSGMPLLVGLLIGLASQAKAQFCYQFSGGSTRFTVSVNNLPGPSGTNSVGPGVPISNGTSYQLSAVSGNSATLVGGQGQPTSPPLPLWLINATGGGFFNTLSIYIAAADNSVIGGISLVGPTNFIPASGLAPLPPLSSLYVATIFIGGTSYEITAIATVPCTGAVSVEKTLGNPACRDGGACVGDPINLASGSMFDHVTDYETGGPDKLAFVRYYNSQSAAATIARRLGIRWRSNFDRYLTINSASSITAERADGQQVRFTLAAGRWAPDTDIDLQLSVANGVWSLTNSDDSVETYTTFFSGVAPIQTIRARNGYIQTVRYAASGEVLSVSDSNNRTLLFTYSGGMLRSLTTPDDLVVTYAYTASGVNTANPSTLDRLSSVGYSTTPPTSQTYGYTNPALPFAITQITDENGSVYASWTYDRQARALSSEFAEGADRTTVTYNDSDGSRTVTNALGQQLTYKFSTLQGTPKMTQTDRAATATTAAATRRFTYDNNGFTASETDWNGNLTVYVKNSRGLPTSITEASGTPQARTTTITYHSVFHLPTSVATPGLTTTFTYDPVGNLLTRTQTDTTTGTLPYRTQGTTRKWTYTWANGLLASIQGPRTDGTELTKLAYDNRGFLASTTNAAGHVTEITNSPGGLPQALVDANKVSTALSYDQRLRLVSRTVTTASAPLVTNYSYDAVGNLLSKQLPDGSMLTNTYDAAHRLTQITDAFGESLRTTLDLMGNPSAVDALNGSGASQRSQKAEFDALGRRLSSTGGEGQKSSLTYDAHDRPLTVTDPNGAVTSYTYNGFGDLIQRVSPDTGTTVYRYDASGNLSQMVDARAVVADYSYDALNRLTATSYPANPAENVSYIYDEEGYGFSIGRLTTVNDAAGTLHRTYDERGNVLVEARSSTTTSFTYDAADRIASLTYPSGWKIDYARDVLGRVIGIAAKAPTDDTIHAIMRDATYRPFGPVSGLTFGNDVVETRLFDADYRITKIEDQGSSTVQSLAYEYDAANNVLGLKDGVTSSNDQAFVYDPLDRLTHATGGYGAFGYGYDTVGNRLTETLNGEALRNYAYLPKSNRLTSISGAIDFDVSYTESGNTSSFVQGDIVLRYTYNRANRLARVDNNGTVLQYTYDAFGQRLAKTGEAIGKQQYRYDLAGHLLEEINPQGEAIVDYVYLGDQPVALIEVASGKLFFLHTDRLGTPQRVTADTQDIAWRGDYHPFGELNSATSQTTTLAQSLRFPGQEAEPGTGLYHNGFRDYLPGLGRYLQSDPIGLAGGVNTYGYARANPAKFVDPAGLADKPPIPKESKPPYPLNTSPNPWKNMNPGIKGILGSMDSRSNSINKALDVFGILDDFSEALTADRVRNIVEQGSFTFDFSAVDPRYLPLVMDRLNRAFPSTSRCTPGNPYGQAELRQGPLTAPTTLYVVPFWRDDYLIDFRLQDYR